MFRELSLKIRRRETPFYDRLFLIAKGVKSFEIPVFRPLYKILQIERDVRRSAWSNFKRIFYYTPLIKLQCESVGKRLHLEGGLPVIMGNLHLVVGDDVAMDAKSTFTGAKVFDKPTLTVGNNTYLGYELLISVGSDVTIGNNVLIGYRVSILSYDGHPANPAERHLPASKECSKPIIIKDNVWLCGNCVILKGVTIGENSIVANGCVLSTSVPPNSLVFGNPAKCIPLKY